MSVSFRFATHEQQGTLSKKRGSHPTWQKLGVLVNYDNERRANP